MAEEGQDVKPAETLTIGIKDQSEQTMHFKIKNQTRFEKVFKSYAERKGVDLKACRFLFNGTRVKETATPADLEMDEGDTLDVILQQVGGQ